MSIRALPQELVDQIAAGEVVERPASVIKELVENSLDAGARRIEVQVEGGGRRRLAVHDDGKGIPADELALAVQSHATSKLVDADALEQVATYGFRGEALASVASISYLTLTSRPRDCEEGAALRVRGGILEHDARPEGRAPGTTVDVRDLFFNTPARRKFLKTDATELSHVIEAVLRLSLARPDVGFSVQTDARRSLKLDAGQELRARIAAGYGRSLGASLLPVRAKYAGMKLWGYLAPPDQAKARTTLQQLYVNGRYVRDRTVQGAVRRAYSDYLAESLRPIYFLFLEIDPGQVDCNVHPTKIEVRLRNSSDVFRMVVSAVDAALRDSDLAPRVRLRSGARPSEAPPLPSVPPVGPAAGPASRPEPPTPGAGGLAPAAGRSAPAPGPAAPPPPSPTPDLFERVAEGSGPPAANAPRPVRLRPGRFVQIRNTYLVTECEEGLLVLDQHALHERVLYRRFREEWRQRRVARQELLTPVRVELSAAQVMQLQECDELLDEVGVRLAPFDNTEVAVSAVPVSVNLRAVPGLIRRLAEFVGGERPEGRGDDFADRMLFTMACHRAIRAGDPLADELIDSLLEEAERIEHAHTCPHGRPTRIVIPVGELETLFKRTGF